MCESANPSIRPPKNRKPASSMLRRGVMGTGTLFWSNKTAEVKHGGQISSFLWGPNWLDVFFSRNYRVEGFKLDSISPILGVKIKKILKPPPSYDSYNT